MNSQQIEYVLTLARLRSFSKAAQELYVTQPSLSQYIMKTEEQLGVKLFDRTANPIKLTEEGKAYVRCAQQIKALEESFNNQISDMAKLESGSLKIGASSFRASCLLAKSVAEFCSQFSRINVTIVEESVSRLTDMVKNNELDVMVSTGSFDSRFFHTEELAREKLYLAVPKNADVNDKLSDKVLSAEDICTQSMNLIMAKPVKLSDLNDEHFIMADRGEYSEDTVSELFENAKFSPAVSLRVRTVETLFSFVNAGFGVGLVPDSLIRFGNFTNHPCYYLLDDKQTNKSIYLVSKKNGYFSKAAQEYCLILKKLVDIGTWRV